jgi:hypothetical protein
MLLPAAASRLLRDRVRFENKEQTMMDHHDITRRDFLKTSAAGGLALATGFSMHSLAHAQSNIRFSTWHVPAGYEVKTVWEPMLEELKKKSGGNRSNIFAGGGSG